MRIWSLARRLAVGAAVVGSLLAPQTRAEASLNVTVHPPTTAQICYTRAALAAEADCGDYISGWTTGDDLGCPGVACFDEKTILYWIDDFGEVIPIAARPNLGQVVSSCPSPGVWYFVTHWEEKALTTYNQIIFGYGDAARILGCELPDYH